MRVNVTLPHQTILRNAEAQQLNVAATTGDMGILSDHVPSIEQLRPGMLEIVNADGTSKRFFGIFLS